MNDETSERTAAGAPRSDTLPDRPKTVEKPEAGTRLSAGEIHDNILGPAEEQMKRPASSLWWSALGSGLTIGFSFLVGGFAETLVDERYALFVAGLAYPLGFLLVIFARSELFTENTLEPVIPLLHRRDMETFLSMLRLWGLLLLGNLVGSAVFAWVMYHTPIIEGGAIREKLVSIATTSTSDGFSLTLIRAVMAGWLIALLTWLLASTQDSVAHVVIIWATTAPIAWLHFRHSIVGSVEALYLVAAGARSLWGTTIEFIVPAVLGNAIGGVGLVALLNYGQVHHERASGA